MKHYMGHSSPTLSCLCIYPNNLFLLTKVKFETSMIMISLRRLWSIVSTCRQNLKGLMTQPSWSCSARSSAMSATAARPACSNTSLESHAKVIVFIHFFLILTWNNCPYCLRSCTWQGEMKSSSNTFKAVECLLV